jgi:hypothetical protein
MAAHLLKQVAYCLGYTLHLLWIDQMRLQHYDWSELFITPVNIQDASFLDFILYQYIPRLASWLDEACGCEYRSSKQDGQSSI